MEGRVAEMSCSLCVKSYFDTEEVGLTPAGAISLCDCSALFCLGGQSNKNWGTPSMLYRRGASRLGLNLVYLVGGRAGGRSAGEGSGGVRVGQLLGNHLRGPQATRTTILKLKHKTMERTCRGGLSLPSPLY